MSRHIPVAAKREVLYLYRLHRDSRSPYEAMSIVMRQQAAGYAERMVNGDKRGNAQQYLDRFRAARFYMFRDHNGLYGRKWRAARPVVPVLTAAQKRRLADA